MLTSAVARLFSSRIIVKAIMLSLLIFQTFVFRSKIIFYRENHDILGVSSNMYCLISLYLLNCDFFTHSFKYENVLNKIDNYATAKIKLPAIVLTKVQN